MAAKDPERLMVAVDFGTTFSSVAFSLSRKNAKPEVVTWWGDGVLEAHEVPTIIQYDPDVRIGRGPYKWGLQVSREDDSDSPIHEWFKLSLYPPVNEGLLKKYPSTAPSIDDAECKKLVIDFLTAIRSNFDSLLQQKDKNLERVRREYIITVPAIWTDKAKDITRQCAVKAGMGDVQIIKEPEAAGIYAIDTQEDVKLKVDDTFVICDAGGGTVDLISYTVASLKPTTLVEAAEGSGGLCGSSFLNRAFEAYLDRKFRDFPQFDRDHKTSVMQYFEQQIKPRYAGLNTSPQGPYRVPVRGIKPNKYLSRDRLKRELGIENERLDIPKEDLEPIFEEVVLEVIKLVQNQIFATRKNVRSVLLAGGFGQSHFLRKRLKDHLKAIEYDTQVIHINEGKLAIVRGALIRGLTRVDKSLPYPRSEGRMPTRSYGFAQWVDFDPRKHDPTKKKYDPNKGKDQIETMYWCIEQGSLVMESKPQPRKELCAYQDINDGTKIKRMTIPVYTHERRREGEKPPQYKTSDLKEIVILTAKLDRIPKEKLHIESGCYVADFDVEVTLNSANYLTFNLIVDGWKYAEESVGTNFV